MSKYSLDYLRDHSRVDVSRSIPWTARALGITTVEQAEADLTTDGDRWLYNGPVPMAAVRDLLDAHRVESEPLTYLRPAKVWDDPSKIITFDGQSWTVCSDATRQVIYSAREDTVHMVPRSGYEIHQHTETLVDRTARIVGHGLAVSSVVVLADGAEAVIGVSTANLETTPEGVAFYSVLLSAGSHNGTLSSTWCGATIMPVCDNTRDWALSQGRDNGTMRKIKHTRYSEQRLDAAEKEVAAALGMITERDESFAAYVAEWCAVDLTESQGSAWIKEISGLSALTEDSSKNARTRADNAAQVLAGLRSDSRVAPWWGTGFGALQLASTFDQWERGTRGGTDPYARIVRETITGATASREGERVDTLRKILATV